MDNYPTVSELMASLETIADLIAGAIVKKVMPVQDDITENQAKKAYGDRWLRKMKRYGLAKSCRVGSRIIYSRSQLDALRIAERDHERFFYQKRMDRMSRK